MQIVTSWMEEGIQQRELKIIERQLTRRIGAIAPELQEQVRGLSLTQLEDLAEALLDFSTEADLIAWLQQQQS
ncbi:DUF4351 domain-containing protein [Dendronalium sp. ChiSLP03b]|uniref:DUF4351 domain-containing protein n=1 Tax=Dendronalium sp. ChiSLP03b TaxID=3075381 RepID=UPI002AD277CD|nr:DUF4351 domain-containing protein [Dendronalium sp. ChiSLP03b]MDZ8206884.1 DUF4351 domain-containing protein [Dendronalium sp. ChiSLP03b]